MTSPSQVTRQLNSTQRAEFHKRMQFKYGHWWPTEHRPRPASSYRAARRNAVRRIEALRLKWERENK
jgi:hypothetical protein